MTRFEEPKSSDIIPGESAPMPTSPGIFHGDRQRNTKAIIILFLCALVAVLAIIILVVNTRNERTSYYADSEYEDTIDNDEILEEIKKTIRPLTTEETITYLDDQINTYEHANADVVTNINIIKINALINAGQPDDAIKAIDDIDDTLLNERERIDLYQAISIAYNDAGNYEMSEYYQGLRMKCYLDLYNGGGGGE